MKQLWATLTMLGTLLGTLALTACQATPAATAPTAIPPTAVPATTNAPAATTATTHAPAATTAATPASDTPPATTDPTTTQELTIPRAARLPYLLGFRNADGTPGAGYWQNRAQHSMRITVAPPSRVISATQEITYTNASPYPLQAIVFRTYFNAHHPDAERNASFPPMESFYSPGLQIDAFRVNGEPAQWTGVTTSTLAAVRLPAPLQPNSSVTFSFAWHYQLANANGWKEGAVDPTTFYLAYFYPRVAVLDDTGNWDLTEFLMGSEFYDDNNDYTFEVSAPRNYLVWATGDLQNPDEVLQPAHAQRLRDSFTSDSATTIATVAELQQGQVTAQSDSVTWRWRAENVRDIAIGLSDHFQWDAGSVVVDPATERRASVQAAYPVEATEYARAVEFGKTALTFGSTEWPGVPYPYSKTTIFVGGADEEYPMMVNDSADAPPGINVDLVAGHEILHSWFPFYMGTNEERYPFMDEGWVTAFEYLLAVDTLGQEQATAFFQNFRARGLLNTDADLPIIVPQTLLRSNTAAFAYNQYGKAALAYLALKDLLGDEAFRASLHAFMERWHGRHPLPWDMFNTFNDTAGQDLTWFFHNWFYTYNYVDVAVQDVQQTDGGYTIQVRNTGGMAIPFDVQVVYADNTRATFHQTPALWEESPQAAAVTVEGDKEVISLTLETGIYPDSTPTDNAWPRQ